MAELEQTYWTDTTLAKLSDRELLEVAAKYVAIMEARDWVADGIDWNFERAEVKDAWLDGRDLRDELVRRSNGVAETA